MSEKPKQANNAITLGTMELLIIEQAERLVAEKLRTINELQRQAQSEFRATVRKIANGLDIPEDSPIELVRGKNKEPHKIEWYEEKAGPRPAAAPKSTRARAPKPQAQTPKKRGRPKKKPIDAAAPKKKRGRPPKIAPEAGADTPAPKKRGRPKKTA